jgi:hypothetical protein
MRLIARSPAEAHLYIALHPCDCGEAALDTSSRLLDTGTALVSVYEGSCGRCARQRRFELELADEPVSSIGRMTYGGPSPSTLICPAQFLELSERYAKQVPASVAGLAPAEHRRAAATLETALAAVEEVLKFIPPGADLVPPTSFRSTAGKRTYLRDPRRFQRARLRAVATSYARLLERYRR